MSHWWDNMIYFSKKIVSTLNRYIKKEAQYIELIKLASFGLSLQFVDFEIHCSERVFASIDGKTFEWDDAPSSAPWGLLGRQLALKAELTSPSLLRIIMQTGDYIEIETVKSEFESVIFQLPPKGETLVMEIF